MSLTSLVSHARAEVIPLRTVSVSQINLVINGQIKSSRVMYEV